MLPLLRSKRYGKHKHFYGPLRALAARASTGGLGRSVESKSRRRGDEELLLQSQQPSADGLRVSHDRSERDILVLCCFLLGARGGIGGLRIALVFTGLVSRFRASLQRHAPAGRQRASAWARAPSAFSDLSASRFGPGRKTNKESNRVRVINDQPAKPLVSKRGYAEQ